MKLNQVFESALVRGQMSVGTKIVTYKSIKKGNKTIVSASVRSTAVGSVIADKSTIKFMDESGSELLSIRNDYSEMDETTVKTLVSTLVELVGGK